MMSMRRFMTTFLSLFCVVYAVVGIPVHSDGPEVTQDWMVTWGGPGKEICRNLELDGESIYIVGDSYGSGVYSNATLIKFNTQGEELWNRSWGGGDHDYGYGVAVDSEGYVYITGFTWSYGLAAFLAKYSSSGDLLWNITWGATWAGPAHTRGTCIAISEADDIYVGGYNLTGGNNVMLAKFNTSGTMDWIRFWNPAIDAYAYGITVRGLNEIYLTGEFSNSSNLYDVLILKYNANGDLIREDYWHSYFEGGRDVVADAMGNYFITGYSDNSTLNHVLLLKYDTLGRQVWNRTWRSADGDLGARLALDGDSVYIAGNGPLVNSNASLLKYDTAGTFHWAVTWGGQHDDWTTGIAIGTDHQIYLAGHTENFGNGSLGKPDIFLIKYTQPPSIIPAFGFQILGLALFSLIITYSFRRVKARRVPSKFHFST